MNSRLQIFVNIFLLQSLQGLNDAEPTLELMVFDDDVENEPDIAIIMEYEEPDLPEENQELEEVTSETGTPSVGVNKKKRETERRQPSEETKKSERRKQNEKN